MGREIHVRPGSIVGLLQNKYLTTAGRLTGAGIIGLELLQQNYHAAERGAIVFTVALAVQTALNRTGATRKVSKMLDEAQTRRQQRQSNISEE